MLTGVHVLLSYACLYQCDHCFLHCSPASGGAFSLKKLTALLDQAAEVDSVTHIAFEGGEPFLFHPVLVRGVEHAVSLGLKTEIVTNAYWALDAEDAEVWLHPLAEAGLHILSASDDAYHQGDDREPARAVLAAATALDIECRTFTIDPPTVREAGDDAKGAPIVGGGVRFRGRAADTLTQGLPLTDWHAFTTCPDEDFAAPGRVHVDAHGDVQLCQGIVIGNVWKQTLGDIMNAYTPETHPVCGPLLTGGPAGLARALGVEPDEPGYVDACHLCYRVRQTARPAHPTHLAPGQAYGETE